MLERRERLVLELESLRTRSLLRSDREELEKARSAEGKSPL